MTHIALTDNEQQAIDRFNKGEKPSVSTFIDEVTITHGYGLLHSWGDWEFPLPTWFCEEKGLSTYWDEKNKVLK